MREWLYYNFAAGSFHTKKLCSRLYSIEVDFCSNKTKKIVFEPLFLDLGVMYALRLARWKARGQLYIHHNWASFAISYGRDIISGNRSKSAFFEGGWVTFGRIFDKKGGIAHQTVLVTRVIAVSCDIKISTVHHLVLSQYTHLTDRQTDRQTELRQQYRVLHNMPHGKNQLSTLVDEPHYAITAEWMQ